MVEPEPLHGAGAEVVGHDVGLLHQLEEDFLTPRVGHNHAQAALVAGAVIDQVAGFVPPLFTRSSFGKGPGFAVLQVVGAFDADDIGAQIRKESRPPRQRMHLLQGKDSNPVENSLLRHCPGPPFAAAAPKRLTGAMIVQTRNQVHLGVAPRCHSIIARRVDSPLIPCCRRPLGPPLAVPPAAGRRTNRPSRPVPSIL